jgi:hypothetical protein
VYLKVAVSGPSKVYIAAKKLGLPELLAPNSIYSPS